MSYDARAARDAQQIYIEPNWSPDRALARSARSGGDLSRRIADPPDAGPTVGIDIAEDAECVSPRVGIEGKLSTCSLRVVLAQDVFRPSTSTGLRLVRACRMSPR